MIITKTPFRVSFAGGGSDMPSFYREHGGCVISTSINRYMYISIHPYFDENKTFHAVVHGLDRQNSREAIVEALKPSFQSFIKAI